MALDHQDDFSTFSKNINLIFCSKIVEKLGGQLWIQSSHKEYTEIFFTVNISQKFIKDQLKGEVNHAQEEKPFFSDDYWYHADAVDREEARVYDYIFNAERRHTMTSRHSEKLTMTQRSQQNTLNCDTIILNAPSVSGNNSVFCDTEIEENKLQDKQEEDEGLEKSYQSNDKLIKEESSNLFSFKNLGTFLRSKMPDNQLMTKKEHIIHFLLINDDNDQYNRMINNLVSILMTEKDGLPVKPQFHRGYNATQAEELIA